MRKYWFFFAFLAFILGGAQGARAEDPSGHAFCKGGMPSLEVMAARTEQALALDRPGQTPGSHALASCLATPQHLLAAIKKHNPNVQLASVSDLPNYFRTKLVEVTLEKDSQVTSDCLWAQPNGTYAVKNECVERELKVGEKVYKDRDTGVLTILSGCANPGVIVIPPIVVTAKKCYKVPFPSFTGRPTRIAYIGRNPLPGYCTKLAVAGETKPFYDMPEECPATYTKTVTDARGNNRVVKVVCSWSAVEQAASEHLGYTASVQNVSGSFYGRADGTNVMYLPEEALDGEFVVCYDNDDRSYGVRREHYDATTRTAVIPLSVVNHN